MVMFFIPPLFPILAYIFMGKITPIFIAGIALYIPLLIFAFFYPLSGAHTAMKIFKEQELKILSKEFNKIYDFFINDVRNDKCNKILPEFEMLSKLDELYEKAERMPVWPFDTQTITKFGTIIGAIITSIWLNWLFGKMVQL